MTDIIIDRRDRFENCTDQEFLVLNKKFKDFGFERVLSYEYPDDFANSKKLTLILGSASYLYDTHMTDLEYKKMLEEYPEYQRNVNACKIYFDNDNGLKIPIKKKIGRREIIFGHYTPQHNLVIIYGYHYRGNTKGNMGFICDLLEDFFKVTPLKKVKIDTEEILARKFTDFIESKITSLRDGIKDNYLRIERRNSDIMLYSKRISTDNVSLEGLENVKDNIKKRIKEEISKLSELNFVKEVGISQTGLKVTLERIYLKYKGRDIDSQNIIEEDVDMGEYEITLTGENITIKNKKYFKEYHDSSPYYHPHVTSNSICFGTFANQINRFKTEFNFRELIVLINMMLKTWNPDDKYLDLRYFWKRYNRDEEFMKKFPNVPKEVKK